MKEDWVEVEFVEVCDVVSGKNQSAVVNPNGKYPIYGSGGIIGRADDYICEEGTTIIGRKGTINSPIYVRTKFWNVDTAFGLSAKTDVLDKKFLYFFCVSFNFKTLDKSTAVPSLAKRDINQIQIPLAPLPEQRAIVSRIEELFSAVDSGVDSLRQAQAQLKVYRQAVLKKAFEGELTREWRDGGADSSVGPIMVAMGTVIDKPKYGTSKKCESEPVGTPVLRIPNIGDGLISHDDLKYAVFDKAEKEGLSLRNGDLLTIRSNGSIDLVGKCALVTESDLNCLYAGYLIRLRPIAEKVVPKYLLYCLQSHSLRVQIESKAKSTSGVNNINSGELADLRIPMFILPEQHQIVQEIEKRLSVCDSLEAAITDSLRKAEALRQSILKKAFAGQLLTEAELAACRKEEDWEPAGVLLERVKKEKEKNGKKVAV